MGIPDQYLVTVIIGILAVVMVMSLILEELKFIDEHKKNITVCV